MTNIVQTAIATRSFKTLVAAVQAASLVETLSGPGPFTVFAPTDEAFAKLPAATVEGLLKDIPKLKGVLTYHVAPGKVMAMDVVKLSTVKTVQGQSLTILTNHRVHVDNAKITKANVVADNGVIPIIDSVMLPK